MILHSLIVNGNSVDFQDQPEGLDGASINYVRDHFNGFQVELEYDLTFRCGSGKEEIDAEYDSNFENGTGTLTLYDKCNDYEMYAHFNLDFSKYKRTPSETTIGLIEVNDTNDFKDQMKNDVEIPDATGQDVYVRNLPVEYNYYSDRMTSAEDTVVAGNKIVDIDTPFSTSPVSYGLSIYPKTNTTVNELESGYTLLAESFTANRFNMARVATASGTTIAPENYYEIAGNLSTTVAPITSWTAGNVPYCMIEPQPIFTNEIEDGLLLFNTAGDTGFSMDFTGGTIPIPNNGRIDMDVEYLVEYIMIGKTYNPTGGNKIFQNLLVPSGQSFSFGSGTNTFSLFHPSVSSNQAYQTTYIGKGWNVWIWYEMRITGRGWPTSTPANVVFQFDKYSLILDRAITIKFTANKNVTTSALITNADLEAYSTKVKAFHGSDVANILYPNLAHNIFESDCYKDFWITNGEYVRNKTTKKAWKMKPQDYFDELDKILSVGLGIFYDSAMNPTLELQPISEFYSTDIGLEITENYGEIQIETDTSRMYNQIEIGYNEAKDTHEELHAKNSYNIPEQVKGKNTWSKISNFIASKFIFQRTKNMTPEDSEKEYDNRVFIISAIDNGTNHIHSLSQSAFPLGLGYDDIAESLPAQTLGMNRKFSSVFNLIRNIHRYGFGLYKSKTDMNNTSLSPKELAGGTPLAACGLNKTLLAQASLDYTDVDGTYTMKPEQITISVLMTPSEFWELRKIWYKMVKLSLNSGTYYGNILSAKYLKGVVKFQLISRNPL